MFAKVEAAEAHAAVHGDAENTHPCPKLHQVAGRTERLQQEERQRSRREQAYRDQFERRRGEMGRELETELQELRQAYDATAHTANVVHQARLEELRVEHGEVVAEVKRAHGGGFMTRSACVRW